MDITAYSPSVRLFLLAVLAMACMQVILVARLGIRRKKIFSKRQVVGSFLVGLTHLAIFVFWTCSLWALVIEPQWIEVNVLTIPTDKWVAGTRCRIAQLSDTHLDTIFYPDQHILNILKRLQPDVIVFTGDAVNRYQTLPRFRQMFAAMDAPLGRFAVKGNWDYHWPDLFVGSGFEELILQTVHLQKGGQPLGICGIAYHNARRSQRALNDLDPLAFNILLHHSADLVRYVTDEPIDLYLCGHTHGGQVNLPAVLRFSKRKRDVFFSGFYLVGTMTVYVNRGIGMTGFAPPARFRARPEIAVFDIIGTRL